MNYIAALCGALAVSACATTPVPTGEAAEVPAERVFASQYLKEEPNTGVVTLKRDSGFVGSACATRAFIDGKPVVDVKTSEKVALHLPIGSHILSIKPTGICAGGTTEKRIDVSADAPLSVRMGYTSSGDLTLNETAF